jgi:hypothetical protein
MTRVANTAIGSAMGAVVGALIAPHLRGFFAVPAGGIGFVTVHQYPKGWDYAVVALLIGAAFVGGAVALLLQKTVSAGEVPTGHDRGIPSGLVLIASVVIFVAMLFIHDHPFMFMDPFHEGEHLTPAFLLREGARPYTDIFFLHGFATDGGLDTLVLGSPPSPHRTRRLETVLNAATLALIAPIAAEITATPVGALCAAAASLCGVAAGQLPVFPYFRLAPVLIAALALLRYARRGSGAALFAACSASTLGILWSLDTGTYALGATAVTLVVLRLGGLEAKPLPWRRIALCCVLALLLPLLILIATRAGLRQFFVDSFLIIPRSVDAIWALPAPPGLSLGEAWKWLDSESARYYVPPAFYGFLLALALVYRLRGDRATAAKLVVVAIASMFVFRTTAGRVAWSHTRFGAPLFGAAVVAFAIEPLLAARRRIAAVLVTLVLLVLVEARANAVTGAKLLAGWRARRSHAGLVPYPFATGKGIYTTVENAADLAALNGFVASVAPPGATILDFSNERALYYLLQRKPPVRCFDIAMLSAPALRAEAMRQLDEHPPACVILKGIEALSSFDGVPNDVRVPELARWIDAHYPRRVQIGRFVVAAP